MIDLSSFSLDIEDILEDLRLHWVENTGYRYNDTAFTKQKKTYGNIMMCCPFHHETNPSFGVFTDYPWGYNCFGCGASGNLERLIAHVVGLPTELHGLQFILKNYVVTTATERPPIDLESILDGNALDRKRSLPDTEVDKFRVTSHPYFAKRGFSEHTIQKYELGFDKSIGAVTFPVRTSKGLLRFIKKRYVSQKGFLNQSGIDKKDIVYGLYYILRANTPITEIYLNESETDTISCYEGRLPAGAVLGRIMFKEQVVELVRAGIKTVNLFFDNDKAGIECTFQAYELLSKYSAIRLNVVVYPGGAWGINTVDADELPFKDANDLLIKNQIQNIDIIDFQTYKEQLREAGLIKTASDKGRADEWRHLMNCIYKTM